MSELRYADSGGLHIAYRVYGGADGRDVVLFTPGGTIPMGALGRDRVGARLIDGLSAIGRLVLFDRRGIGMSDPITDWDRPLVEQWADDLRAVVEAADLVRPVVVCLGDYWGPARIFAGTHVDGLGSLVLYEPIGPVVAFDLRVSVSTDDWITRVCPSRVDDADFRQWFEGAGRSGASPGIAARLYDVPDAAGVAALETAQGRIAVPTLVLRRPGSMIGSPPLPDPVVVAIADAVRVDLPGPDYHWLGEDLDHMLAEISRFVTGETRVPAPQRVLCAVLFTDIVGSTERAAALGDARWKTVLDRHDSAIREEVERSGGTVVKTTGDGVLATLPSGDRALRAAAAIRARLVGDGLGVRIGVHVGDVERRGDDVAGVGVHVAARVMGLAGADEILVTASVPIAVMGTAHDFTPRGRHVLKGAPGEWELFAYASSADEN